MLQILGPVLIFYPSLLFHTPRCLSSPDNVGPFFFVPKTSASSS
jgi:hypothetical protein